MAVDACPRGAGDRGRERSDRRTRSPVTHLRLGSLASRPAEAALLPHVRILLA